jgi:hypothetical protein
MSEVIMSEPHPGVSPTFPNASTLRELIEVEETVHFWGYDYKIIPVFVERVLGDGKRLLALTPLNTRPNYYVIRVDSKQGMQDQINDIIEAIIEEYSEIEREREYLIEDGVKEERADLAYYPKELGWPVFSGDSGYSWCEMDWPKREAV